MCDVWQGKSRSMANEPASFWTQANALLRKNLTFQVTFSACLIWLLEFEKHVQKLIEVVSVWFEWQSQTWIIHYEFLLLRCGFRFFRSEMLKQTFDSSCSRSCYVCCCFCFNAWWILNWTRQRTSVGASVWGEKETRVWRRSAGFSIRIWTK